MGLIIPFEHFALLRQPHLAALAVLSSVCFLAMLYVELEFLE
jgi:hypothetical protein